MDELYFKLPHSLDSACTANMPLHLTRLWLVQVSDAATAIYNKVVPSAEAKESEARQHLHQAGDAAEHAGQDLKTSAHEVKEAIADSARSYGRAAQDRCHTTTRRADDTCLALGVTPPHAVQMTHVLRSLQSLLFARSYCLNTSVSSCQASTSG